MPHPSVIPLSGGLDSATVLAMARSAGFEPHALSLCYGQRHVSELDAAARVASTLGAVRHEIIDLDLRRFGSSALTDNALAVPTSGVSAPGEIPVTYVPARNTIMLSVALGLAEALGGRGIFFGANAVDYSGYPDCRPDYVRAFEAMANLATKAGVEGELITVHAPIIAMTKSEIIRTGAALGVDYAMTISCYQADPKSRACGRCESCRLRASGFADAGLPDPTCYR